MLTAWKPIIGFYIRSARSVRIPDEILSCVGFIAEVVDEGAGSPTFDHIGTGFFVSIPSDDPQVRDSARAPEYFAFVTAAHVVKALTGKKAAFIVNKKSGGVMVIEDISCCWYRHPSDPSVDVAIIPFGWNSEMDIKVIPTELFVPKKLLIGNRVGLGDEVYMPGLFTHAIAKTRNMPIVRYGTLAMLPDEPIQVESGFSEVYLIEARSIGGMSGSPVFVRPTTYFTPGDERPNPQVAMQGVLNATILLGLVHGHWDIRESDINDPHLRHDPNRGVNMGVGVVVPAHKILEVINHPELVEMRKQADLLRRWQSIPTPD